MQKRRSHHTIRDIARLAGVSRSTVSLALNDSPRINSETKKHVMGIIEEVGYRPNHAARNLASRTSKTILVILPEMDQAFTDGYYSESLSGILDAAAAQDYHLLVQSATELFKRENRPLKLFRQQTIDAVLSLATLQSDTYLQEIHASGCPLVLVNSMLPGIASVRGAAAAAGAKAVAHLHQMGHTRIGHITGNASVWAVAQRTAGYHDALADCGLSQDDTLVARGGATVSSGEKAMKQLLARDMPPTAVFCATDILAIGALQAAEQAGLNVPQDLAIVGGDDALAARFVSPQITTIQPSMYTVGELACDHLVRFLEGTAEKLPDMEVELPLLVRKSCRPVASPESAPLYAQAV